MHLSLILIALLLLTGCESKPATQSATPAPAAPAPMAAPVAAAPAPADSLPTFSWADDACTYTGTYDPNRCTRRQVAGTYQTAIGFGLLSTPFPYRLANFTDETFRRAGARLEREYDSLTHVLRAVEVVPTPFWRQLKHLRELELAEQYERGKLEVAAYFQPAALHQSPYYARCATYADALAATDTSTVLRAWRQLILEEKVDNAYPAQFDQEYAAVATSPDGIRYAKMRLFVFGWSNCTNKYAKYNDLENQYQPMLKFEKLFRRIRQSNCVDVD